MPEYRTPLPALLANLLETGVNQVLDLDENAPERLARLDGKLLHVRLEGVGISLYFAFGSQRVNVSAHSEDEPDTVVSGTPSALFAMAAPEELGRWGSAGSRVSISGDATLARDLERLFSKLDPDWEDALSGVMGDVLAHQVASGLRSSMNHARAAASNAGEMLNEYLQKAEGPLAQQEDIRRFSDSVEETSRAVDELERKIRQLEKSGKAE